MNLIYVSISLHLPSPFFSEIHLKKNNLLFFKENQVEVLTQQPQNNQRDQRVDQKAGDDPEGEHHSRRQGWKEAEQSEFSEDRGVRADTYRVSL